MRVVKYDRSFSVIKTFKTYDISIPSAARTGIYTRLQCDAMAVGKMLRYYTYKLGAKDAAITKQDIGQAYEWRSPIKGGGCIVVMPSLVYTDKQMDRLLSNEIEWHRQYGWLDTEGVGMPNITSGGIKI